MPSVIESSIVHNQEGIYKHPETGAEVAVRSHPKLGTAMADGFVAGGFVYDRPLDEAKSSRRAKPVNEPTDELPGEPDEVSTLRAQLATSEAARKAAEAALADAAAGPAAPTDSAPEQTGKPLTDYKLKELVEIAKKLGVENAEELGKPGATKDAAIAVIEAAQEAKVNE